jgi:Putative Ig domain
VSPYSWSISAGTLPTGLTLAASTGVISGTPTLIGSYTFTIKVTDNAAITATKQFTIVVQNSLSITTASLDDGQTGQAYLTPVGGAEQLAATGGRGAYTWQLTSGSLPAGLSLASATGIISGTPTVIGTSTFTVKVTDAYNSNITKTLSIAVKGPLTITTTTLPDGIKNKSYSISLAATGGRGNYTWSVFSGTLPTGLTLSTNGTISGTPSVQKVTYNFTVKVTDAFGSYVTADFSIYISA